MPFPLRALQSPTRRLRAGLLVTLAALLGLLVPQVRPSAAPAAAADYAPAPAAQQRAEHLERLGADRWHAAGYRGRGVKVAVLDSGFRGYRAFLGKALPPRVTVRSFRLDGDLEARDSQHGILCAEVVHAVAPEAELLFANWEPDRPDKFLEAVRWARQQGARVLSCSLIMPSWSDGEGGGSVNAALARLLGNGTQAGDPLCFASAGNTAQRHWTGPFHAGTDGCHEWCPGRTTNLLVPWGNERVSVELYGRCCAGCELSVCDAATGTPVGRTGARRSRGAEDRDCAQVRFQPQPQHTYLVRLCCKGHPGAARPGPFHLVVLGGGLECATAWGSVSCPADCPAVLAVGAVDGEGRRQTYSSCGPNSARPKPDFVAQVPFPSAWRERPFAGTSAAAPQAAGLAALWWSRHPDWTAERVRVALRAAARDLGPPGHDWETGHGLIRLP
jgi:subtilisin family serine protease